MPVSSALGDKKASAMTLALAEAQQDYESSRKKAAAAVQGQQAREAVYVLMFF